MNKMKVITLKLILDMFDDQDCVMILDQDENKFMFVSGYQEVYQEKGDESPSVSMEEGPSKNKCILLVGAG